MTYKQTGKLLGYYYAAKYAPRATQQGRRTIKGKAGGFGAVLKTSRVHSMSTETQHFQRRSY